MLKFLKVSHASASSPTAFSRSNQVATIMMMMNDDDGLGFYHIDDRDGDDIDDYGYGDDAHTTQGGSSASSNSKTGENEVVNGSIAIYL